MLLRDKLSLVEVFRITWKLDFMIILVCSLAYFADTYWLKRHISIPVSVTGVLGTALAFFIGFNNNQAYDRWWEGRKQWGMLVNNSRNLALKLQGILPAAHPARAWFRHMIPNFAYTLKDHLRGEFHPDKLENMSPDELSRLQSGVHAPNQVAALIIAKANELYRQQVISGDQLITINHQMEALTDIAGACERIKNTPIPFSYSVFLKKFIFFYVMTLPMGYVFGIGLPCCAHGRFIFYVLASLELTRRGDRGPFWQGRQRPSDGNDQRQYPQARTGDTVILVLWKMKYCWNGLSSW